MSITRKGWDEQFMLSGFSKEATFDTGVTMNASNAFSLKGFSPIGVEWDDTVVNDKDDVTNTEFGTDQELVEQGVKLPVALPKAKPNDVAALATLTLGSITSTLDVATAYGHKITPVAMGSALPSIQAEHKKGGIQYAYKGIKSNSLKLSAEAGGHLSVESELIGSGTRSASATAFVASITESWMKMNNAKCWTETGSNISITGTLVQGAQDISNVTPDDLKVRIKSFEFGYNNNLEKQIGFGGAGVAQDIDYARRTMDLKFTLNFLNSAAATEFAYYTAQDAVAFEIDLKGSIISGGGTSYYGVQLIIPRGKLKKAPLPQGGPSDILTQEYELDIQNDGTNDPVIIEVYNAQAAYLA